jgi:arylsulfatase A-like enzyme
VFAKLSAFDVERDTLVIVTADHGEELDDHGCWFDHHGLYDTNVRVPLLLRFPDGRGAGRGYPSLVGVLDLAPTVLDTLGLGELALEHGMPGRSLLPVADGGPIPPLDAVYLTECTWMRKRGWRTPEWKLIRALEPDIYGKPPVELYELRADSAEQRNVADARPEVAASLTADMDAWIARRLAETGLPDPIVDQADALRIWQPRFIAGRRATHAEQRDPVKERP